MQTYLFGHDYGMGAVLVFVDAETPAEVVAMYPLLKHIPDKPEWLNDGQLNRYLSNR